MAEQIDMGRLSLNDSQHAPGAGGFERSAYIPPHLRSRAGGPPPMDGPPPMMNGGAPPMNGAPGPGINGSAWGPAPG
jgi:ATP-dependent RNA helicase DDX3X